MSHIPFPERFYLACTFCDQCVPLPAPANAATPALFCHADADEVVRHEFGVLSADALTAAPREAETLA